MIYWMANHANREQWAWQTLPTFRPCFPPRKCKIPHPQTSLDEYLRYGPLGFQICKNKDKTNNEWQGCHATTAWSINTRVVVGYLPLGRSESSFLQRTVGTGSPWTTQWNLTLSSASTTTLLGRFTKVGRSGRHHQYNQQISQPSTLYFRWAQRGNRGRQTRNWDRIRICNDTSWFQSNKWNRFYRKRKLQQENHSLR